MSFRLQRTRLLVIPDAQAILKSSMHGGLTLLTASLALCIPLGGCGGDSSKLATALSGTPQTVSISGRVMSGQQPIGSASIQLYAAGSSGYGSAYLYPVGTSLLGNHVITTAGSGEFNISGDYNCPSSSTEVYIEAIGGVAIAGQAPNPNILMIAALGPCGSLPSLGSITINELTTVASVWALAPFMTGPTNVGTSPANSVGLRNAFAAVGKLVDPVEGALGGPALPPGASIPAAELNTLADIIASCIDTSGGGTAGDGSACGNLFALAVSSTGVPPADVVTAVLNIAHNPTRNVVGLNKLAGAAGPFQPILPAAPVAWTMAIQYAAAGLSAPTGIAADPSGNLWVTNAVGQSVTLLNASGAVTGTYAAGQVGSIAIAVDPSGDAWVAGTAPGSLLEVTPSGSFTNHAGDSLTMDNSLAIDGSGYIWASGAGSAVSVFNNSGAPITTMHDATSGLSSGQSLAITSQ